MNKLKVLELFGGIGACSKALENLNIDFEIVDYVEIDKYAVKSFNAIHNTDFEVQDVCTWNKNIEVDLIMHGSPCQDFSLAGKQAGGDKGSGTRSSLMYETLRIVENLNPKYVIWENVKNIISKKHIHNFDKYCEIMTALGYNNYAKVLNAKDYGIPQNRERVFTISIRKDIYKYFHFPEKQELKLKLKDMLEDKVEEKYYLNEKQLKNIQTYYTWEDLKGNINTQCNRACNEDGLSLTIPSVSGLTKILIKNNTKKGYLEAEEGDGIDISTRMQYHRGTVQKGKTQTLSTMGGENNGVVVYSDYSIKKIKNNIDKGDIANTLTANVMQSFNHDNCQLINTELRIRKLTPKECWRLMGFNDIDFDKASKVCSNSQLYKQAGNSIVVNVLMEILKELLL